MTMTMTTRTEAIVSKAMEVATEVLATISGSNSTGTDCDHHRDADVGTGGGGGHKNIEELKLANQCVLGVTLGLTMVAMGAAIDLRDFKIVVSQH